MFDWISTCIRATASEPLQLLGGIFLLAVVTAGILLAAKAADVAEQRGHSPLMYGLLGLLMPIGFPLYIINNPPPNIVPVPAGPPPEIVRKKLPSASRAAAPRPPSETDGTPAAAGGEIPVAEAPLEAEYFLGLIQTGAVTPATPCLVVCGDGTRYVVTCIAQVQAGLIVVTARIGDGPEQRMRIPYARMQHVGPVT